MMIDINLIAQRRQQRLRTAKLLRLGFYAAFALVIGLCLLYAGMTIRTWGIRAEITTCDVKLSDPALVRGLQRVDFLEQQTSELKPKVELLTLVRGTQRSWRTMMEDFSSCIPGKVWMTGLNSRRDKDKQTLTVAGGAMTQCEVGEFMLNLNQASWCQPPKLTYTRTSKMSSQDVVSFEFTMLLASPIGSNIK